MYNDSYVFAGVVSHLFFFNYALLLRSINDIEFVAHPLMTATNAADHAKKLYVYIYIILPIRNIIHV